MQRAAWINTNETTGFALKINGTASMTGFQLATGAATNTVLTSDASGTGSWQSAVGLIGSNALTNSQIQSVDWSKITNVPSSFSNNWSPSGNSGTNPASNFLGTTDNQPLTLKVNGRQAMRYSYAENTATAGSEYRNGWQ